MFQIRIRNEGWERPEALLIGVIVGICLSIFDNG